MNILNSYEISEIEKMLFESKSFRDFLLKIGHSSNGSSAYRSIKDQLIKLGLALPKYDYSHLKNNKFKKKYEDVFMEKSTYSRQGLKKRIIEDGLIEYICEKCRIGGNWQGEKLSLQLEHKNGINNDNRLENLCFLCPNCHSQTNTFSGKKLKKNYYCECGKIKHKGSKKCFDCDIRNRERKIERPLHEQLIAEIEELGYRGTGRKYGVSDNSIRKWVKSYKIELI